MKLQKNQKLVLIGDSITDMGRTQPVAEGLFDPLGRGYVTMVDAMLHASYPDYALRLINVGTSGNTVRDLAGRWQRDVFDLKPDWLSVMIGINDVWRQFDLPKQKEIHVLPEEYESTLDDLLSRIRPKLKGLILATPYFIEPNRSDPMRAQMDRYGQIVKTLAKKHEAILVDTQAAFDRVLAHLHPAALAWDRVHPNQTGHMVLALAFARALEVDLARAAS